MRNTKYFKMFLLALKITIRCTMVGTFLFLIMYACSMSKIDTEHFNHVKEMREVLNNSDNTPYPNQNFVSLTKKILDLNDEENDTLVPLSTASGICANVMLWAQGELPAGPLKQEDIPFDTWISNRFGKLYAQ